MEVLRMFTDINEILMKDCPLEVDALGVVNKLLQQHDCFQNISESFEIGLFDIIEMNFCECNPEQEAALRDVVGQLSRRILDIFEASLLMKQLALEDGTTRLSRARIETFVAAIREEAQIQCLDINELQPASVGEAYARLFDTILKELREYLNLPSLDLEFLHADLRDCMDVVIQRHVWRRVRIETETHRRVGEQIEALMALASDAGDSRTPRLLTIKPIPLAARAPSFRNPLSRSA
ncbi:hypothetical protein H2509_19240 [Stappia sp. F7233]|uniref:Uncharacterized protein n=1 Tax=Stappia albiluteola TaxID=2758565 RepID=A0A839AHE0_9HYPH|nr:hypothetical protein [Stappia albiluteola]MBA5779270.1 hypothetical protein [Stappia albiluteola]